MQSKLIVALDFDNELDALTLIDQIDPSSCGLKVGSEMFTRFGPAFVKRLVNQNFNVFLDLKFHDIPNTVSRACAASAELGVWMLNVHASGGFAMMQAARKALDNFAEARPLLIAVTILTSLQEQELLSIGLNKSLPEHVTHLAKLAREAGLDGVVSSALEVPLIKSACGPAFLAVTPGIRMENNKIDDQQRVITPSLALKAGSDYLVIGRPVTRALKPMDVISELLNYVR